MHVQAEGITSLRATSWASRLISVLSVTSVAIAVAASAGADTRVQDIARLKGQRTNKLMGYGLVIGLNGTGDGGKYLSTMRALMSLHNRYQQPVLTIDELKNNDNVALVTVEATIPEFGAREGEALDLIVSAESATSLENGQLLTTPLQFAMFDPANPATMPIFALAGGRIDIPDPERPTRGIVRRGATLEEDFLYGFIQDQHITLVLDDTQAGFPLAHLVARAVNHELENTIAEDNRPGVRIAQFELAYALGPKNVRVRIPPQEMQNPAGFISRVLQTPLFGMPEQAARVFINRGNDLITFSGTVTIAPTVLVIPGLGTVAVGGNQNSAGPGVVGLDSAQAAGVQFQELINALTKLKLSRRQMVEAIEHLHRTGALTAQLIYTE